MAGESQLFSNLCEFNTLQVCYTSDKLTRCIVPNTYVSAQKQEHTLNPPLNVQQVDFQGENVCE